MIRFLSFLCCLSVIAGDHHLRRRRTEGKLRITSNYTFDASFELLFDLKGVGDKRGLNGVLDGDVFEETSGGDDVQAAAAGDDDNDADVDGNDDPGKIAPAMPKVQNLAFGNGALNAIRRSMLKKITKDNKCMLGVEATSGEIDYQQIGEDPQEFDPSIVSQRDRELQFTSPGFFNWLRLVANIQGQCNGFCGDDDSDDRRLETDDRRLEMERELQTLQDNPEALKESCTKLAKKILKSAGRKYPLLPNVERIGIKFFNPHISVEEPIIVWWPSPPDTE